MEDFRKFMDALENAENKEELLGGNTKPESEAEVIAAIVSAAKKLGFDFSEQDVEDAVKAITQERLARTEKAQDEIREVSADNLDKVAGGKNSDCESTYLDRENCWWDDGCDASFTTYTTYLCKRNHF